MKKTYEAWTENGDVTFVPAENISDLRERGLLGPDAKFLHRIEADTFEEALAVHYLRIGRKPFQPNGKPVKCPKGCGAYFYPESSGECPTAEGFVEQSELRKIPSAFTSPRDTRNSSLSVIPGLRNAKKKKGGRFSPPSLATQDSRLATS